MARLRPTKKDVVIGVSASGLTPFVRGALTRARKSGLRIIFVTCWPGADLQNFVDLVIAPSVGPEVLTGSTRLKAGTATKMVLNMLTTIAMVRIGKTYGNLMVDVQANSEKLKDRARRIVGIVTGLDYDSADELLRRARWNVKIAVVMHRTGSSYTARRRQAADRPKARRATRSARTSSRGCARCSISTSPKRSRNRALRNSQRPTSNSQGTPNDPTPNRTWPGTLGVCGWACLGGWQFGVAYPTYAVA